MAISVIAPITPAWERMMLVCFRPFNFGKWFSLGFCAWLATLGQGIFSYIFQMLRVFGEGVSGRRRGGSPFPDAAPWVESHLPLVIMLVVIGVLIVIALAILLLWLRSRGRFMFLDGVIHNRDLVAQPWREFRVLGNSLFLFYLIVFISILLILILASLIALPDILHRSFGPFALSAIIVVASLFLLFSFATIPLYICVDFFLIPLMYLRRQTIRPAWREFRASFLLPGKVGPILLFCLMYIVLGMAGGFAFGIAGVLTCCIGSCLMLLPYIGAVVTLPLLVFLRSYVLYFFQQFGPQYQIIPDDLPVRPGGGFPVILDPPSPPT